MANTTKNLGEIFHNDNLKKERIKKIEKQVIQVKSKILEAVIFTKMKRHKTRFLKNDKWAKKNISKNQRLKRLTV